MIDINSIESDPIQDTLVIIKNDSIKRKLIGEIICVFEKANFEIVGMKMTVPSEKIAEEHYPGRREWREKVGRETIDYIQSRTGLSKVFDTDDPFEIGTRVYEWSLEQLTSGRIIAMVLRGPDSVEKVKNLIGPTYPSKALAGTIRGSYATDTVYWSGVEKRALHNVIHRSSSIDEANREIPLWFEKRIEK